MKENADKDFVVHESLKRGSDLFMNGAKDDEFNTPLRASVEWWEGLSDVVGEVGVLVGGYEMFRDDVEAWVKKIEVSGTLNGGGGFWLTEELALQS